MNTNKKKYLSCPIIPMIGAGDIKISESEAGVIARMGKPDFIRPGRVPNDGVRFLHYTGLMVWVCNGTVKEIHARNGYIGLTKDGLGVGTNWPEVCRIYPAVRFSEEFGHWYVPGINGMSIEIFRPPRKEECSTCRPERLDGQWVDELYEVRDPEHAFVGAIAVHNLRY